MINQTTTHIFELTHTSVTFQMAPGQGKDLRVAARVVDRVSAPTPVVAFSYNPPRLETVVAPLANKDGEHTGPTSGCLEFEGRADWNQRLEGYDEATIQTKPTLLQRLCKRPGDDHGERQLLGDAFTVGNRGPDTWPRRTART